MPPPDDPALRKRQAAPLPPAANLEQLAALSEATADARPPAGHFVVLARQEVLPEGKRLAAFAEAAGVDAYTATQWFRTPTARILRREDSAAAAGRWVDWLRQAGVRSFALDPEALAAHTFLRPLAAYEDPEALHAELPGGEYLTIPKGDVLSMAVGEVTFQVLQQTTTGKQEHEQRRSTHCEVIVDVHRRSMPEVVRFGQDSVAWSKLYPDQTGASALLIRKLQRKLQLAVPHAPVFDQFIRVESALGQTRTVLESSSELVRNWLHGMVHVHVEKRRTLEVSNLESFNLYSILARLEGLRA